MSRALSSCLVLFLMVLASRAGTIYTNDFSKFSVGDDQWAGHDGWIANSIGEGASGIGTNLISGYGNSAWIGFGTPATNLVSVSRQISNSLPVRLKLEAVVGITPSSIGSNDVFAVSFYNTNGSFLAGINFDTTYDNFGIWRDDSVTQTQASVVFNVNQLYQLSVDINYQSNSWSGYLNGVVMFQDAKFSSSTAVKNAGSYAFEWGLTSVQNPGDNWMFVDNLNVSIPNSQITLVVPTNNAMRLTWIAGSAGNCQVQTSTNLVTWTNLSGAVVVANAPGVSLTYLDQTATNAVQRFYRILQ